jgi:hypothetical protein
MSTDALLYSLLNQLAKQVDYRGHTLTGTDWGDIFAAAMGKGTPVPGERGLIMIGLHLSEMSAAEKNEVLRRVREYGDAHGVRFKEDRHLYEEVER